MERRRVTAGIVPWRQAGEKDSWRFGQNAAAAARGSGFSRIRDHEARIAKASALLTAWTAMVG